MGAGRFPTAVSAAAAVALGPPAGEVDFAASAFGLPADPLMLAMNFGLFGGFSLQFSFRIAIAQRHEPNGG